MTKNELAKYAGHQVYAMVSRMGGQYKDINCITVYEITKRGTLKYVSEAMSCVANKSQVEMANMLYPHRVCGRPTAEKISANDILTLIK